MGVPGDVWCLGVARTPPPNFGVSIPPLGIFRVARGLGGSTEKRSSVGKRGRGLGATCPRIGWGGGGDPLNYARKERGNPELAKSIGAP